MSPDQSDPPNGARGSPPRFRTVALASGLLSEQQLAALESELRRSPQAGLETTDPDAWDRALAKLAARKKSLTSFQARQLLLGRRRFTLGQYRILDEIGRGGMGQVFKAEHPMMGRVVAVKVLPRAKSTPDTEAAFQREIRVLGRLDHDNLVRALDAGHDGNVYYLVTEYVAGLDLRRQISKYGPLDEPRAAMVIAQAARALAYAHDQGLVHRDVKPGNLLVTRDGRVKLLDLGLAGSVFEAESMRLGRCVGTMDYMAPEQIRDPDNVGPSADIYSLGCTLYFAVTGRLPFPGGDRKDKARRQLEEKPADVRTLASGVSLPFARVIEAMMEKSPKDRIDSALEVIGLLRPWIPAGLLPMPRQEQSSGSGSMSGSSDLLSNTPLTMPGVAGGSSGFLLGDSAGSDGSSPLEASRGGGSPPRGPDGVAGGASERFGDWSLPRETGWLKALPPRYRSLVAGLTRGVWRAAAAALAWSGWLVRLVDGQRLLRAALQSVLFAAPVGVAFGLAIHAISQINPEIARRLLRDATPTSLGWAAFWVMAAVQFFVASSRGGR